ncbi:MAG: UDP-3-O-(3-hydroxymyristoyl)glucosamine N-acyltransferase [Planctomycetes bacterium]|jgi:UDP-3-O-[3-hydroxymyristoyl] glucosamine N-acyltransferase|nr:UDP-3-O-(3-hydroxymyristoyl)glucosamine N-acyltransferase [Planctomycetota bacterium]
MITHTAAELARICGATLDGNGEVELVGPASLSEAASNEVSFIRDGRHSLRFEKTRAGAVFVPEDLQLERSDVALLRTANPSSAFSLAIESFRPPADHPRGVIHPRAAIDPTVELGEGVSVGAGCCVGAGVKLGAEVVLHPGCVVGPRVEIGAGTVLFPNVVLYGDCRVGERCVLHAGCVLGADGFGFEPGKDGWEKVPQCGTVEIGDDVEIGANSCIDRGRFGPTRVEDGVKIDNLVQLGHNVVVGKGALLVSQVGVAGSVRIGPGAVLGGQVGVAGHLEIGAGARLAGQSGAVRTLAGGKDYYGMPAREAAEALRIEATLGKLPEMRRLLRRLEKRVRSLESQLSGEET